MALTKMLRALEKYEPKAPCRGLRSADGNSFCAVGAAATVLGLKVDHTSETGQRLGLTSLETGMVIEANDGFMAACGGEGLDSADDRYKHVVRQLRAIVAARRRRAKARKPAKAVST